MRNSALIGIAWVALLGPTADKLPAQFDEFAYEAATRRIHQMISQIADVKTAAARSEVFDRFVVSRDEYLAIAPVLQSRLLVDNIDETSALERKAAVVGRVLSWGHIPCWGVSGNSPAFQEYCRYFTHTDPRVKAIAFAFASQTLCASYDELGPTFAGCRDSSPMVRSAAFHMLDRQLEHMWGESSARSMAIDLVIAAFQSDRRVSRKPLYDCARQLGPSLRIIADDLFQGMYDEVNGDAAADALARVDGRAPMVRRVVAALQVRSPAFERSAITYFSRTSYGAAPEVVLPALAQLLAIADRGQRCRSVELVLTVDSYAPLHAKALQTAEMLVSDEDDGFLYDDRLIPVILKYGLAHSAGADSVRRLVRSGNWEVRDALLAEIEILKNERDKQFYLDIWNSNSALGLR